MHISDLAKQLKPYIQRWIDGVGAGFVRLAGSSGGQTVYGGTAANEDMTLEGTSHATKTTSYIILQPTGGNVVIGATSTNFKFAVVGDVNIIKDGTSGVQYFDTYGNGNTSRSSIFLGRKAQGTLASPTAAGTGDVLLILSARGWTSAGAFSGTDVAKITAVAAESFTSTAQGAYLVIHTTPIGTITPTEIIRVDTTGYTGFGATVPAGKIDVRQTSSTAAIPTVRLQQDDISEGFVDYVGTSAASAAGPISSWTVATLAGFTRCEINGVAYWQPFYNAPTA